MKKIFSCLLFLAALSLTSCNSGVNPDPSDPDEYYDRDVIENYQIYDKNYNPDTFTVNKIKELEGRDDFIFGADISLYSAIYESGALYYNQNGKKEHICKIIKDSGINLARLRLFYDYTSPYGTKCGRLDLPRIISMISDCKEYGLNVLLDFHYSDDWTNPGMQEAPYAWKDLSYQQVLERFYSYTKDVLQEIKNHNLSVEYVQIGNEIDNGIIYPFGQIDWDNRKDSYDKMAEILSQGSKATREIFPNCKIIIHTANGLYRWIYEDQWGNISMEFYEAMEERHLDYDIIGASFYTFENKDTPINLISNIIDNYEKKINKPVIMVESSYAFTYEWNDYTSNIFYTDKELPDYPVGFQGQTNLVCDLIREVASARNNKGIGYCYWGADFIPNVDPDMRTSWANQALFTYEGIATPTLSLFNSIR
ncbi:MAG: arabinogalactan endo-1,4-beta-galactosidase [Bacilli bacterium]|nr:arabinogalactan endo-1,4-beta-galactosidase [Bacilli bacterium]